VHRVRRIARDVTTRLRGHDVALYAAGLTFYGGIALLPTTLLALWLAGRLIGADRVARLGADVAEALPPDLGAPGLVTDLVAAGSRLGWVTALLALVPATLYGEGMRRAFVRLDDVDETYVGWRGRLGILPLLAFTPLMVCAVLTAAPLLARLTGQGGWSSALAVYVALCLDWVLLTGPLAFVYRVLAPQSPPWRHALLAGTVTASFVAGFLQGFVLFLAIPLDLGLPFGGFAQVGAVVAVALWLWVLHLLVLVGHAACRALTDTGRPGDRGARRCARRPGRAPRPPSPAR
jgi:membrane protein